MPDPRKILAAVHRATTLFRATPGRVGAVVHLDETAAEVFVVGDLHGQVNTFARALKRAALDRNPGRHLVLQELVHGPFTYPDDGGDRSHQLVDVVCALKCQYPDRVHLILGNHELSELTGRSISKAGEKLNDLFRRGLETAYGPAGAAIHVAYRDLFRALPLIVRTANRVHIGHTLPEARHLDGLDLDCLRTGAATPEDLARGGAVYALTWGRDVSIETADRFAALVDADLFVCGHQPFEAGFSRANDRLLILDATDPNPMGCLFPATGPIAMDRLVAGVVPL